MGNVAHDPAAFYASPLGTVAQRAVGDRLLALWPDLSRQIVLGVGFTAPFLALWNATAERCLSAGPVQLGHPGHGCLVDDDALPFPDLSIDRIVLVHGLENAENARRMLREAWRVLKDDGRLLVVAPNRLGLWAHVENTPFGQGQPYSPGQVGRVLAASLFRVERRDQALYLPPLGWRPLIRSAALVERTGRRVLPRLGGVTITEAVKDVYAAIPLRRAVRRQVVVTQASG